MPLQSLRTIYLLGLFMKRFAKRFGYCFLASFFAFVAPLTVWANHTDKGITGIAAVPCSNIIMFQENPVTQKDVTGWLQKLVSMVNKSAVEEMSSPNAPQVKLTPELLWFGTLLYCGLDPSQPLVRASLRLIDAEWDKLREISKKDL